MPPTVRAESRASVPPPRRPQAASPARAAAEPLDLSRFMARTKP
jgi:hypothetical protein